MKITDEDGDPKNMKSGEMTPSQEASLQRRRIDIEHSDDDSGTLTVAAQTALLYSISNNNKFNVNAATDHDDDKLNDNDANAKKVSFKCKRCNFR